MHPAPEFSRSLNVSNLPADGLTFSVEAKSDERRALRHRLGLEEISKLCMAGQMQRGPRPQIVILRGVVDAMCVQTCVVTFDPVPQQIHTEVERYFHLDPVPASEEIVVSPDDEEPEPLEHGIVDLGEVAVEELSLALDPYPHAPHADAFLEQYGSVEIGETSASPFDVLDPLRRKSNGG